MLFIVTKAYQFGQPHTYCFQSILAISVLGTPLSLGSEADFLCNQHGVPNKKIKSNRPVTVTLSARNVFLPQLVSQLSLGTDY